MKLSNRYAIPAVSLTTLFVFIPAGMILLLSLYKTNFLTWSFVGVSNYRKLVSGNFPRSVLNSLIYLVCIPLPGNFIGLILAVSMANLKKQAQNKLLFMFMMPTFAAGIIIAQFWKWIIRTGGIDISAQFPGVPFISFTILVSTLGMEALLLSAAIKNIDPAQYESAMLDGASWTQIKLKIIVPQIMKTFSVLLLFGMVGALQIWETIYILAPFESTSSMMYRVIADGFFFGKYGLASAECVVMALIIILLTKGKERIEKA